MLINFITINYLAGPQKIERKNRRESIDKKYICEKTFFLHSLYNNKKSWISLTINEAVSFS